MDGVGINRRSVAHVDVKHPVFSIRPHDGKVAFGDDVFYADRIVGRVECQKNVDVFVEARAGLPEIPLVCRGVVSCGQALGHEMVAIIDEEFRRQDGPIVGVKHSAAEKLDEPGQWVSLSL